jgi:hypothetical protein
MVRPSKLVPGGTRREEAAGICDGVEQCWTAFTKRQFTRSAMLARTPDTENQHQKSEKSEKYQDHV